MSKIQPLSRRSTLALRRRKAHLVRSFELLTWHSQNPKGAVCLGMTMATEPSCALKPESAPELGTRYVEELAGQLRCFDRVILHGTLIPRARSA